MARQTDLGGIWELSGTTAWDGGDAVGPLNVAVPGFVSGALEACGILPPLNSPGDIRGQEWVSRRIWRWERRFTLPEEPSEGRSERYYLHARVNGAGYCEIDGQNVGCFDGPWKEAVFDITGHVEMGGEHLFSIVLEKPMEAEEALPLAGIQSVYVRSCAFGRIVSIRARGEGNVLRIGVDMEGYTSGRVFFHYRVLLDDELVISKDINEKLIASAQSFDHELIVENPSEWHVRGHGPQNLYTVRLMLERGGTRCDSGEFRVGFPKHSMRHVPGAIGALPYALFDGEEQVFIFGTQVNTPVDGGVLESLAGVGINLIRFSGPLPPDDSVYDICDGLGMVVWQEMPTTKEFGGCAGDMAGRLATRPSAAVISGPARMRWPDGTPAGLLHPDVAKMREAAHARCPWLAFFPTTPSGPVGEPNEMDAGRGLRHDTHGPLKYHPEESYRYLNADDSLLLSRIGMFAPQYWPEDGGDWRVNDKNILQFMETFLGGFTREEHAQYARIGRFLQGEMVRAAAYSARGRVPACAGLIFYLGNMPWPVADSHALIDWKGRERPAMGALKRACGSVTAGAGLEKLFFYRGETIAADISLFAPILDDTLYRVEARLTDMRGNTLHEKLFQARGSGGGRCGDLAFFAAAESPDLILLWIEVFRGEMHVYRDVLTISIPREGEPPLAPLRRLPRAVPALALRAGRLILSNDCPEALLGLTVYSGGKIAYSGALLPWEARELPVDSALYDSLRLEALNI